jgi:3-hydroxy acid dehydrogenase/malonic semialdehyde reductase
MPKTVLITGVTSGIGKACAQLFAREGYNMVITGRRKEKLEQLGDDLEQQYGIDTLRLILDVRDRLAVTEILGAIPESWKDIDVLINNAGLCVGLDPIQQGNLDDWDVMIDTNVKGLLYVTRVVAGWMVQRKSGHIINIGSIAARETYPNGNVYCATKHAVDSLSKAMRVDLLPHRIRVTAVHPGPAETEFSIVRFRGDEQRAKKVYEGYEALTAGDIADAIWFAVSRPPHVNINDLLIMPAAQATATMIDRSW